MRHGILGLLILMAVSCGAAEIFVPADHATILEAIRAATPGDTVTVAEGVYYESYLPLQDGLTLQGASGDPADVQIDSQGSGPIVYYTEPTRDVVISRLTFLHGDSPGGGALRIHSATDLTIADCIFLDNTAVHGGAVYLNVPVASSSLCTIRSCRFVGNSSDDEGGAISNTSNTNLVVQGCVFEGNHAGGQGGAISNTSNTSLVVQGCVFEGNHAGGQGGGVVNVGLATITSSLFLDNEAEVAGGGVANVETISWCDFQGNTADKGGACAYSETLSHCTFTGNTARQGGAVFRTRVVEHCVFADNTADEMGGALALAFDHVLDSVFQDNRSVLGGALIDTEQIDHCRFEGNVATQQGGAVYSRIANRDHTFTYCRFSGNSAPIGSDGSLPFCSLLRLVCCSPSRLTWQAPTIELEDEGCAVSNEQMSFGGLKSIFR